jgi:hypothetical protein
MKLHLVVMRLRIGRATHVPGISCAMDWYERELQHTSHGENQAGRGEHMSIIYYAWLNKQGIFKKIIEKISG